ncbi:Glypican-6 [Blattella germanica]|nr:Glypican-6 [Blattella germanica]
MEHQLSAQSRQEFDRAVSDTLNKLGTVLKIRAQRFDGFFKDLLATSKSDFHDMFKRTYGIIYEQNSYVFTDLFEELERYYAKGQHMKELKPFGDVPHKLSVQLKRSFVATRTFSQALNVASDVVSNMAKINPSSDCVRALTKMTGCPACQGLPELKACSNYCINVMKGCLAYQAELDADWNNFVELEFESLQFGRGGEDQSGQNSNAPTLDKLVKDIRLKVKDTKQFWSHLPYQICNDDQVAASPTKEDSCWNGAMKARYELQIAGDGISNQQTNPEVSVDVHRPSSLLNEQMFALKTITSKLRNAYNGLDVEWIDIEESSYGSGSGSGDGNIDDDDEGSGDFNYERTNSGTGSGNKPYHRPTSNDLDNNLHPIGSGIELERQRPRNSTSGGTSSTNRQISVTRAVTSYLLPIVVMWFGGIFSDWL